MLKGKTNKETLLLLYAPKEATEFDIGTFLQGLSISVLWKLAKQQNFVFWYYLKAFEK